MNKNEFKKTDLIAIAGILMFAIVYAVDSWCTRCPRPPSLYWLPLRWWC